MCDFAEPLAPGLIAWLQRDARIAVQVFFVVGGFLAAKSLAPGGVLTTTAPLSLLGRRYLNLAVPSLAAVAFSIACAAAARGLMTHESIPAAPRVMQIIAHIFLLQDILGCDALSAGIWYVAIDFQLFVLLLGILWMARTITGGAECARAAGLPVVAGLALGSLFYFNRHSAWDVWAWYFFASYALGILTYWIVERKSGMPWLWLMAMVVAAALVIDWRSRIALALVTALALGLGLRHDFLGRVPRSRFISWLGERSYSVFLVHFPVCLVINGLFCRFAGPDPVLNAVGMGLAWGASTAVGALFHHHVASRVMRRGAVG